MSWLVSSIANSLRLKDDDDDDDDDTTATVSTTNAGGEQSSLNQNPSQQQDQKIPSSLLSLPDQTITRGGVTEDLSELSKALTRQLWGVASFLAPPPQISDRDQEMLQQPDRLDECSMSAAESTGIAGIRHDLSEIGGKFRTGISKLSNHKGVSEFTKIASNFLQFGREENESLEDYSQRGVVGVTKEVVWFARDIAVHPETWLDFPLPDEDDEDDFDISDAQQEHALAIECLAPRLAALRIELCPGYMSEGSFWKIYFVLLHPRICRHDAELLSTPQIMKARMMLTQELQHRAKEMGSASSVGTTNSASEVAPTDQSESLPVEMSAIGSAASSEAIIAEIPIIGSAVAEEVSINKTNYETSTSSTSKGTDLHFEDDGDDWLKEENADTAGVGGNLAPIANDEDVSFSDLEDDDCDDDPGNHQKIIKSFHGRSSYPQNDADTININTEHCDTNKVSGHINGKKESIDWLDFNDTDSA